MNENVDAPYIDIRVDVEGGFDKPVVESILKQIRALFTCRVVFKCHNLKNIDEVIEHAPTNAKSHRARLSGKRLGIYIALTDTCEEDFKLARLAKLQKELCSKDNERIKHLVLKADREIESWMLSDPQAIHAACHTKGQPNKPPKALAPENEHTDGTKEKLESLLRDKYKREYNFELVAKIAEHMRIGRIKSTSYKNFQEKTQNALHSLGCNHKHA